MTKMNNKEGTTAITEDFDTNYTQYIAYLLLKYLSDQEGYKQGQDIMEWWYILGWVNEDYERPLSLNEDKVKWFLDMNNEIDGKTVYKYKIASSSTLCDIFYNALESMQSDGYIVYRDMPIGDDYYFTYIDCTELGLLHYNKIKDNYSDNCKKILDQNCEEAIGKKLLNSNPSDDDKQLSMLNFDLMFGMDPGDYSYPFL